METTSKGKIITINLEGDIDETIEIVAHMIDLMKILVMLSYRTLEQNIRNQQ